MVIQYIAGLFDGEGHIGARHRKVSAVATWATISGTHYPMLRAVRDALGYGSLKCHTLTGQGKATRDAWTWGVFSKRDVLRFLAAVAPHLYEKREQAEAVVAFLRGEIGSEDVVIRVREAKRFSFPFESHEEISLGRSNPHYVQPAQRAEAVRLLRSGLAIRPTASRVGISKSSVLNIKKGME